jgi:hypothetical protein
LCKRDKRKEGRMQDKDKGEGDEDLGDLAAGTIELQITVPPGQVPLLVARELAGFFQGGVVLLEREEGEDAETEAYGVTDFLGQPVGVLGLAAKEPDKWVYLFTGRIPHLLALAVSAPMDPGSRDELARLLIEELTEPGKPSRFVDLPEPFAKALERRLEASLGTALADQVITAFRHGRLVATTEPGQG